MAQLFRSVVQLSVKLRETSVPSVSDWTQLLQGFVLPTGTCSSACCGTTHRCTACSLRQRVLQLPRAALRFNVPTMVRFLPPPPF